MSTKAYGPLTGGMVSGPHLGKSALQRIIAIAVEGEFQGDRVIRLSSGSKRGMPEPDRHHNFFGGKFALTK